MATFPGGGYNQSGNSYGGNDRNGHGKHGHHVLVSHSFLSDDQTLEVDSEMWATEVMTMDQD